MKTPLRAILQGLAAGALGTAVFTAYQELTKRDEPAAPPRDWSKVPPPGQVGHRIAEGVFEEHVPLSRAPLLTQAVHWLYGTGWGAFYGVMHESVRRPVVSGTALAGAIVTTDYTLLPAMKLYKPPWRYPATVLGKDFARHLIYGFAVAGSYSVLDRLGSRA